MNWKNLFKKKLNVEKWKNDVPSVEFEDFLLQIIIGQWTRTLPTTKELKGSGVSWFMHLSADELIKTKEISENDLDKIKYVFGKLLMDIGISGDEKCILTDFDERNLSFKLNVEGKESYDVSLRWGDGFDFCSEFQIKKENSCETYILCGDKSPKLNLDNYTLTDIDSENSLFRHLNPFDAYYIWQNGENCLSIRIGNTDVNYYLHSNFCLKNEAVLEEYLLGLKQPIDIVEVFKKLRDISLGDDISQYPEIKIRCFKKEKNKEIETDLIILESGVVKQIKKTQDGKTISFDENGNWTFENSSMSIGKDDDKVRVSINSKSSDELLKIPPIESYMMVSKEVENVQRLVRDLFK